MIIHVHFLSPIENYMYVHLKIDRMQSFYSKIALGFPNKTILGEIHLGSGVIISWVQLMHKIQLLEIPIWDH